MLSLDLTQTTIITIKGKPHLKLVPASFNNKNYLRKIDLLKEKYTIKLKETQLKKHPSISSMQSLVNHTWLSETFYNK